MLTYKTPLNRKVSFIDQYFSSHYESSTGQKKITASPESSLDFDFHYRAFRFQTKSLCCQDQNS